MHENRNKKAESKKRVFARISPKRQLIHRLGIKMPRRYGWARNPKKLVLSIYVKGVLSESVADQPHRS